MIKQTGTRRVNQLVGYPTLNILRLSCCRRRLNKRYVLVAVAVLAICAIAVIVVTALQLRSEPKQILAPPRPETTLPPWNSEERHFRKAAVCSDAAQCAEIGK